MSESKDDSDVELSQETRKVSFADPPPPSSPLPASNPAAAAAAAAAPPSSAEKGWPDQETAGLDPSTLTPLAPVVMHRQATINIGTIGHVAHGKSTVVKAISGVQTVRFKTELERNITIKLGYANAKIFRCDNPKCPRPGNYRSYGSAMEASPPCDRPQCGGRMILQRHVSFVDCFASDTQLMAMDGQPRCVAKLAVGDRLLGPDGEARTVQSLVSGRKALYEIRYKSSQPGETSAAFSCTGGHLLVLRIDSPVDAPLFNSSRGKHEVRVLTGDTSGLVCSSHLFPSVDAAHAFYASADHSPVVFDMTVEAYLAAPPVVQQKARLFRAGQSQQSDSLQFSVRSVGEGEFTGFSTDGDERVLLADGVVVHNCPGHDILMATMLNGAAVMDAAMLLIAGNESCWPVEDTRILTDRGYLFLEDIVELEQRGEQPLFACYDVKSASLVFRPRIGRLVHYEHSGAIVDFTHTAERPRWAADSTMFGASSQSPSTIHTGGHFTLRVTPEHAVFTSHGEWQGNNQWSWSEFGDKRADTAAPTQSGTAIRMLTCAPGGCALESDESAVERELLDMFGVEGTAACDAFLELYGFWLGDGSLDVHNQRVIFINDKPLDVAWLRTILPLTGLPADAWYEDPQHETGVRFAVGPWFAPFCGEYGAKYIVSQRKYSDVRFIADPAPVATPFYKPPKKSCVCLWCDVHQANMPGGRCKHRVRSKVDLRTEEDKENAAIALETEDVDLPSASPSSVPVYKIEAPNVKSAKWFWYWLKKASRRQLLLVLAGLHRADGLYSCDRGEIYTSSVRFRDELLAVYAAAGYTGSFSLKRQAGQLSSYIRKKSAPADIKRTITPQAFDELPGDQHAHYRAVRAKSCSWRVLFSEYPAVALRAEDVQSLPFQGAVWCLTVDHPDHLVVVQRAHRVQEDGKWIVTKAGAAVIVGQCPQPQTSEHLAAVEIMKLKHLLILQNKIDLVKEKEAAAQYDEILNFIRGTVADGSPIIPISAQLKYNIEVICIAAGTAVNTEQGVSRAIEDVQRDERVLALHQLQDGKAEAGLSGSRVTEVLDRSVKRCVELTFSDGRTLLCTPDHRVRTASGLWMEAQQLQVGEAELAVSVEYPMLSPREEQDSQWTLDLETELGYALNMQQHRAQSSAFARLLGYAFAVGCLSHTQALLPLQHQLDAQPCQADIEQLTALRPNVVVNGSSLTLPLPSALHAAFTRCGLELAELAELAERVQHLPAFLRRPDCPLPVVREFLAGCFGGAGGVSQQSGLHWSCAKHRDVAELQAAALRQELLPLLTRCGLDCSTIPSTIDQAAGSFSLSFPSSLVQPFHRGISFRYSSLQQLRLTAAMSALRGQAAALASVKDSSIFFQPEKQTPLTQPQWQEPQVNLMTSAVPSSPTASRPSSPVSSSSSTSLCLQHDGDCDDELAAAVSKLPPVSAVLSSDYCLPADARVLPLFRVKLIGRRDAGLHRVYDLTVPAGSSFTASGVVVHNCEYICKKIPVPVRDFTASPQLIVIRSFDVNKPGEEVDNLKGGVAGGSILKGVLRIGQEIEIRPGIVTKDKTGGVRCLPIKSRIVSLYAEHNDLHFAVPGGLIGVGTKIDPTLTRADRLVGQVLGDVGALPDIFTELEISFFLLRRLLGVKTDGEKKKQEKIKKLAKGEILMVNIGSTSTGARILQVKGDLAKVVLTSPVCTSEGEKLALSRRVEKHWRLIGWGKIRKGTRIVQSEGAAAGGTGGAAAIAIAGALSVGGDGEGVDELDELSKEADQAGQNNDADEDEDEEKD